MIRVLERVRAWSPLGIRFWDASLDVPVTDRLLVHAWPRGTAHPPTRAVRSPGGVYGFHRLPGQEPPQGEPRPESAGTPREYAVAVDDPAGRWLPTAFGVTLPLGYRGEFLSASAASPPGPSGRAYLFSAPSRSIPPGMAAIRADVVDDATDRPAAWAVLTATVGGVTRTGIADGDGRVLLLIPYPIPDRLKQASPPADARAASWTVSLAVRWEPAALRYPFPAREGLDPAWAARPGLKSVLDEQRPALAWPHEDGPPAAEWTETLVHGQELVLRTALAGGGRAPAVRISAGASPP